MGRAVQPHLRHGAGPLRLQVTASPDGLTAVEIEQLGRE